MKKTTQLDVFTSDASPLDRSSILSFNRYSSGEIRLLATKLADQIAISGVAKSQDLPVDKELLEIGDDKLRETLETNVAKALGHHFEVRGRINISIDDDPEDITQYRVTYSYIQAA